MITGPLYDKLKFTAQILLPALGALYFGLAGIWGLPSAEEVVGTIVVVDTFLGVVLKVSQDQYLNNKVGEGTLHVEPGVGDETGMRLELDETPEQLATKEEVRFKVDRSAMGWNH
jgi:hypothetical protein